MHRILPDDVELLKSLYKHCRIPTDQFKRRPMALQRFTAQWNQLTGRDDEPGELLHFMITQRKLKRWLCLGKNHKKIVSVPVEILSPEEWDCLQDIYTDIGEGSDNYGYDPELRRRLEHTFFTRTGRRISGFILMAIIEAKRKRGLLASVQMRQKPFSDMDAIPTRSYRSVRHGKKQESSYRPAPGRVGGVA